MSTALDVKPSNAEAIERVVIQGDLAKLQPEERVNYYRMVCESVGLNPLTRPFEYIVLNGKLTLYARKDATDQLRQIHCVSVTIAAREFTEGCYVVTARASFPNGRTDESIGAVTIEGQKGETRANSMMKAETKAKRRVTLSICGLGMLDELEVETIPSARPPSDVQRTSAPIPIASPRVERAAEPPPASVKGAETPKAGSAAQEQAVRSEPAPREPGDDSDDWPPPVIDAKKIGGECIDVGMQANLAKTFREALPLALRKNAEELRHRWLRLNFFIDKEGNPTSTVIPLAEFSKWRSDAEVWAREQK